MSCWEFGRVRTGFIKGKPTVRNGGNSVGKMTSGDIDRIFPLLTDSGICLEYSPQ
jgi:hypothetical protein